MAAIGSTLGPQRVCCLTGVTDRQNGARDASEPAIYRRPSAFAKSNCLQAIGLSATILQITVREHPQAIQLATANEGYMGLWLRRWLNLPFVIYAHGNEILAAIHEEWEKPRLALQQADCVLANSRYTADLVQQVGVDPKRIELVHPGCETERFRPLLIKVDLRQ